MKKIFIFFLTFFLTCNISWGNFKERQTETIVLIPTSELLSLDLSQMSCPGLNQALAIPKILENKFGKPDSIIVPFHPAMSDFSASIIPTAIHWDMPIQLSYLDELFAEKNHHRLIFMPLRPYLMANIIEHIKSTIENNEIASIQIDDSDHETMYVIDIDWNVHPKHLSIRQDKLTIVEKGICPVHKPQSELPFEGYKYLFIPAAESSTHQLTCKGLNRALALYKRLNELYPNLVNARSYIVSIDTTDDYAKSLMTIEPTYIYSSPFSLVNLINTSNISFKKMTHKFKQKSAFKNQEEGNYLVIFSLPLKNIAKMARRVVTEGGGDPSIIPSPATNIDTIYEVTYFDDGRKPIFKMVQENLNNQSSICPEQTAG